MKARLGLLSLATAALVGAQCPDYTSYAQVRVSLLQRASPLTIRVKKAQGNPSAGPLALPYMRPDPACRTFNSSAVEVSRPLCAMIARIYTLTESYRGHESAYQGMLVQKYDGHPSTTASLGP